MGLIEDDAARGRFYTSILGYAFSGGRKKPDFSDDRLNFAWVNIRPVIDKSLHNRRTGNTNAAKTRKTENRVSNEKRDYIQGEGIGEGIGKGEGEKESVLTDTKEKTAADAPAFSLNPEKGTFLESSLIPGADFTKWSLEQFKRSVDAVIAQKPEYEPYREDFIRYWAEPDKKGRYRFALQKTWATAGRLATWHGRNRNTENIAERGDAAEIEADAAREMRQMAEERRG